MSKRLEHCAPGVAPPGQTLQRPWRYTLSRYTWAMSQRLQAVDEARRVFLIVLGITALLLLHGVIAMLLIKPAASVGPLAMLAALLVLALVALLPLPGSVRQWTLGPVLAIDMLLMGARVYPGVLAANTTLSPWAAEMAEVRLAEPFLFMVIPLVLMAWAYGRAGALLGTLWGGLLQVGAAAASVSQGEGSPLLYVDAVSRTVLMLVLALIVAVLADRQRRQIRELQDAQVQLRNHADTIEQLAVSRERNRMARDLHDTLAHSLAALSIQLQAIRSAIECDPKAAATLADEAIAQARSGLQESRNAIQALRSDPLASLGLIGSIRGELLSLEARTGLSCEMTVSGESIDLSNSDELTIYRICEEALRNIERHATAAHVVVRLEYGDDTSVLLVEDDGQGFEPAGQGVDSFGLAGMRERAAIAGGDLTVQSAPGKGTVVRLVIPRGSA